MLLPKVTRRDPCPICGKPEEVALSDTEPKRNAHDKGVAHSGAPTWRDIQPEDLTDPVRLRRLYADAVRRGALTDSEHERQVFLAFACAAVRRGTNPPALFRWLVEHQRVDLVTIEDETRAASLRARMRDPDADLRRFRRAG